MQNQRIFLHSFFLALFGFILMIMTAVLYIDPVNSQKNNNIQKYSTLPSAESQLDILIIYNDSLSTISVQPQNGVIILDTQLISSRTSVSSTFKHSIDDYFSQQEDLSLYRKPNIYKTIMMSDNDVVSVVNLLGGVQINLDRPLSYIENGLISTLEVGEHLCNGKQILHYLIESQETSTFKYRQKNVLNSIISQLFELIVTDDFQEFYIQLLNCLKTDLSMSDYDKYYSSILFMALLAEPHIITDALATE